MGFSLIASAVVLGISIAMAVQIVTGDIFPTIDHINTAYQDLKHRMDIQAHANINITTINRTTNTTTYDYTITVHNTGTITLPTNTMTILIDGTKQNYTTTTTYLYPDTTATFTIHNIPGSTTKRIKIITQNAIADYQTYTPT